MSKISARFVKKNENQFQVGVADELEVKLKVGGGIEAGPDGLFAAVSLAGDLVFKGSLDATGAPAQLADARSGWFWKATTAGTLLGIELAVGDNLYCTDDVTGTPADGSSFSKIDNTEDPNNVRNAGGATVRAIPRFVDGVGKELESSGIVIDADDNIDLPSGAKILMAGQQINTANVLGADDRCERHVITAGDLAAKFFDCTFAAYDLAVVNVSACGVGQDRIEDFLPNNSGASGVLRIAWSGLGLDGLLGVGDIVYVEYTK